MNAVARGLGMYFSVPYWRWVVRGDLGRYPWLYMPIERVKRRVNRESRDLPVTKRTDFVIEGYPRSGNTFAACAFKRAQPRPVRVAYRCHAPAQVITGVKLQLPTLVLVRTPVDAVVSSFIHAQRRLQPAFLFRHYVRFYGAVLPYQEGYVVGDFEQVKHHFGDVIEKVNRKFGTRFHRFEHTPDNHAAVFDDVDKVFFSFRASGHVDPTRVSRPSADRERAKNEVRRIIRCQRYRDQLLECERMYAKLRLLADGDVD